MAKFRASVSLMGLLLFSHTISLLATPDQSKRELRFNSPAPYQERPSTGASLDRLSQQRNWVQVACDTRTILATGALMPEQRRAIARLLCCSSEAEQSKPKARSRH